MAPLTLERCLYHSSYLNEIRRKDELEIQKAYIESGKKLFQIILATLHAEEINNYKDIVTKIDAHKEQVLIQFYKNYKIDEFLYIGKGEHQGRKEYYLEHCYILFYFIYKEESFFALKDILKPLHEQTKQTSEKIDYKTALQEYVQAYKKTEPSVKYDTVRTEGPAHNTQFTVEVTAATKKGVGIGDSKKKAQQQAALNWFEVNQVQLPNKKPSKPIQPMKRTISPISKERTKELNELYRNLHLSSNDLSLKELDLCFTHKSYANEKKLFMKETPPLFTWFGSLVLPFLVIDYILDDFLNRANGKCSHMIELSAGMVSSSHLNTCLPGHIYSSVYVSSSLAFDSATFKTNIIQALLGGMFLHNVKSSRNNPFVNLNQFALNFIVKDLKRSFDYRSYLQIISQELQADVKVKFESFGESHQITHLAQVKIVFPDTDILITGTGQAPSKKQSLNIACKDVISQLKELFDLNQSYLNLPDTTKVNIILSLFIQNSLAKRSSLKFSELLGGLNLDNWLINSSENIVNHLCKRKMLTELVTLLRYWEKLYGKEVVNECLLNLSSKNLEEIEKRREKLEKRREQISEKNDDLEEYLYLLSEDLSLKPIKTKEMVIGQIGLKKIPIEIESDEDYEDLNDLEDILDFNPSQLK